MANILEQLAEHAVYRTELAKRKLPPAEIKNRALSMRKGDFAFEKALRKPGISFICECKKASPSKGLIAPDFPYLQIAREYEEAGADAVSVLTEPKWFLGSDAYLREIAAAVSVPCLRKDFTVDTENSRRLRERIPRDVRFVSESGVCGPEDVKRLAEIGADAVLVGEALMRATDKKQMLLKFRRM